MSLMGMGLIAYPDVSAGSGVCSGADVPLAEVAAEEPLVDPDRGLAACMDSVLITVQIQTDGIPGLIFLRWVPAGP